MIPKLCVQPWPLTWYFTFYLKPFNSPTLEYVPLSSNSKCQEKNALVYSGPYLIISLNLSEIPLPWPKKYCQVGTVNSRFAHFVVPNASQLMTRYNKKILRRRWNGDQKHKVECKLGCSQGPGVFWVHKPAWSALNCCAGKLGFRGSNRCFWIRKFPVKRFNSVRNWTK